mgnify:CR=1 FL=1
MYTTYKEYLKQETSLPFEEAMQIWNQIAERGEADAACRELICLLYTSPSPRD